MADWLLRLIFLSPRTFRALGGALISLGGLLILFGWRGHKVLAVLDRRLGRVGLNAPDSLAELYPTLPTWWIPETWVGYSMAVLLIVVGVSIAQIARKLEKL